MARPTPNPASDAHAALVGSLVESSSGTRFRAAAGGQRVASSRSMSSMTLVHLPGSSGRAVHRRHVDAGALSAGSIGTESRPSEEGQIALGRRLVAVGTLADSASAAVNEVAYWNT